MKLIITLAAFAASISAWDGNCDGLSKNDCWDHRECWYHNKSKTCCDVTGDCPVIASDVDCSSLGKLVCQEAHNRGICSYVNGSCTTFYDKEGDCIHLNDKDCQKQVKVFKNRAKAGKAKCVYDESLTSGSRCHDYADGDCTKVTDQSICGWVYGDNNCRWAAGACSYYYPYVQPTVCEGKRGNDCRRAKDRCYFNLETNAADQHWENACEYIESCSQIENKAMCKKFADSHSCEWKSGSCTTTTCEYGFWGRYCEKFTLFSCPMLAHGDFEEEDIERSARNFALARGVTREARSILSEDVDNGSTLSISVDNRDTVVTVTNNGTNGTVSCSGIDGTFDASDVVESTGSVKIARRGLDSDSVMFYDEITCTFAADDATFNVTVESTFDGCQRNPCQNGECVQHTECGLFTCDCNDSPYYGDYCQTDGGWSFWK